MPVLPDDYDRIRSEYINNTIHGSRRRRRQRFDRAVAARTRVNLYHLSDGERRRLYPRAIRMLAQRGIIAGRGDLEAVVDVVLPLIASMKLDEWANDDE